MTDKESSISRRDFGKISGTVILAFIVAACTNEAVGEGIDSLIMPSQIPATEPLEQFNVEEPIVEQPTLKPTSEVQFEPQAPELTPSPVSPISIANKPPEFMAGGGRVEGIKLEELRYLRSWEILKLYKTENNLVGKPLYWVNADAFNEEMEKFIGEQTGLSVKQAQAKAGGEVLTYIWDSANRSVFYPFTSLGALQGVRPDGSAQGFEMKKVAWPEGTVPGFVYNLEDRHWYGFAVNKDVKATHWLSTGGVTLDNLADHWVQVEQPVKAVDYDVNDINTWPVEMQAMYNHPDGLTNEQDEQLHEFILVGRVSHFEKMEESNNSGFKDLMAKMLESGYVTSVDIEVKDLNKEQIMWMSLIDNALNKRETLMSPVEYREMIGSKSARVPYWVKAITDTTGVGYGMWRGSTDSASGTIDQKWREDFSYTLPVFGKNVTRTGYAFNETRGDYVGFSNLPGGGSAILMRIKDQKGNSFLFPFSLALEPKQFNENNLCLGRSDGAYLMACTDTVIQSEYTISPKGNRGTDYMKLDDEILKEWLSWPYISVGIRTRTVGGYDTIHDHIGAYEEFFDESGLSIPSGIIFVPYERYHNPSKF